MSKMGKVIHLILKRAAFGHAITFPFDHEFFFCDGEKYYYL